MADAAACPKIVNSIVTTPDPRRAHRHDRSLVFRGPVIDDAASMWHLVVDMDALDVNSPYAYLLVCSHFARTSVVALDRESGALAGFVASYRLPDDPDVLFVWQVGVNPELRKRGIGAKLLHALRDQPGNAGVRHLHATVTPSNTASDRLFRSFATAVDAPCTKVEQFSADVFPNRGHEPEVLYRIGPFPPPPTEEVTT